MIEEYAVTCPACWQEIELTLDLSGGSQTYAEDCSVCCQPMTIRLHVDEEDETFTVDVEAESA